MASIVYFKFKANVKTDSVNFDGSSISVKDLKNAIRTKCCLYSSDFDLKLEDTSGKAYTKDDELIPKYSSIVVRRVPRLNVDVPKKKPIAVEDLSWKENLKSAATLDSQHSVKHVNLADSDLTEEEKIKIMMERSSEVYSESNFAVKAKPYGIPPAAYVCHKCNQPGHWIHNCPGVRDKTGKMMDVKAVKRPTGIPQDFLLEVDAGTPGAYLGKSGKYMVPIKDAVAYAQGKKDKRPFSVEENPPYVAQERTPPKQLVCPLCDKLFTDAVLVSCCGTTYCNECIMGHVFDSQVLGSHKCPSCDAMLTDHESNVFENTVVRSLIRDWLADESKLPEPDIFPVHEGVPKLTDTDKPFTNYRRVLKPKQATTSISTASTKPSVGDSEIIQSSNGMKPESKTTPELKNKHSPSPPPPKSDVPQTTNSVTLSNSTILPIEPIRVSELSNTTISSIVNLNTNTNVVTSSACTTLVTTNRQALLAVTSGLSNSQLPCMSYSSSTAVMPTVLSSINGGGNPFLNALYSIQLDNLQTPLLTQTNIGAPFHGSLVGGPEWSADSALAVSAAQGAGMVDPVIQLNSNQTAFGLVPGQAIPGSLHANLPAPIETLNGHKMLSKEEFYRLKMEVLHSSRRRHRHRSRSRSPGHSSHRVEKYYAEDSRRRHVHERDSLDRRSRHYTSMEYDSIYSRRRHHHHDDYCESRRDRFAVYRSRNRPLHYGDLDGGRERFSRERVYSPERRTKRSSDRSPIRHDWHRLKGEDMRLSPDMYDTREFSPGYLDAHGNGIQYGSTLLPRKRSPISVVPQYDISDEESIGPRNPSAPREHSDSQQIVFADENSNQNFKHDRNTCSFTKRLHTDGSISDSPTKSEKFVLNPCLMEMESKDDLSSGTTKVKRKKEKKHKKHKHKHSEKKKLKALLMSETNGPLGNQSCLPDGSMADFGEFSDHKIKKHKKHKKHKHGKKDKTKKIKLDAVNLSNNCINEDKTIIDPDSILL